MDVVISESRQRLFAADGAVDFFALADALNRVLARWLVERRWFGGKAKTIRDLATVECIRLSADSCLLLVEVAYTNGEEEIYTLPLGLARAATAKRLAAEGQVPILARLNIEPDGEECVVFDAMADRGLAHRWLELIARGEQIAGRHGRLVAERLDCFNKLAGPAAASLEPTILTAEQSNSSILFGDRLILKLFRRSQAGVNPDVEVTRHLTGCLSFSHVPPLAGTIAYERPGQTPASLAVLQGFIANQGDAWRHTLARLNEFFDRVAALPAGTLPDLATLPDKLPLALLHDAAPPAASDLIGPYLAEAALLGRRTAELHLALATPTDDVEFQPEPFGPAFQRGFYETTTRLIRDTFALLGEKAGGLAPEVRESAQRLLELEADVLARFRGWLDRQVSGQRTRVHGDYHLGQVLWTGGDFVIIDFEGEPARSIAERRLKQSPLRDVAGMLRSFHYAAHASLIARQAHGDQAAALQAWSRVWHAWSSAAFLREYLAQTAGAPFLPREPGELQWLLGEFLLEKAVYEMQYELNNRPDWLPIPLGAVLALATSAGSR